MRSFTLNELNDFKRNREINRDLARSRETVSDQANTIINLRAKLEAAEAQLKYSSGARIEPRYYSLENYSSTLGEPVVKTFDGMVFPYNLERDTIQVTREYFLMLQGKASRVSDTTMNELTILRNDVVRLSGFIKRITEALGADEGTDILSAASSAVRENKRLSESYARLLKLQAEAITDAQVVKEKNTNLTSKLDDARKYYAALCVTLGFANRQEDSDRVLKRVEFLNNELAKFRSSACELPPLMQRMESENNDLRSSLRQCNSWTQKQADRIAGFEIVLRDLKSVLYHKSWSDWFIVGEARNLLYKFSTLKPTTGETGARS